MRYEMLCVSFGPWMSFTPVALYYIYNNTVDRYCNTYIYISLHLDAAAGIRGMSQHTTSQSDLECFFFLNLFQQILKRLGIKRVRFYCFKVIHSVGKIK